MPFESTEEIINDISYENEFTKRIIKCLQAKKECRITREQKLDAEDRLNEAAESIFNETIGITETDLNDRIYDADL